MLDTKHRSINKVHISPSLVGSRNHSIKNAKYKFQSQPNQGGSPFCSMVKNKNGHIWMCTEIRQSYKLNGGCTKHIINKMVLINLCFSLQVKYKCHLWVPSYHERDGEKSTCQCWIVLAEFGTKLWHCYNLGWRIEARWRRIVVTKFGFGMDKIIPLDKL